MRSSIPQRMLLDWTSHNSNSSSMTSVSSCGHAVTVIKPMGNNTSTIRVCTHTCIPVVYVHVYNVHVEICTHVHMHGTINVYSMYLQRKV